MSLRDLGFTPARESVYRELLSDPTAGVGRLAARTGLEEAEVADALEELAEADLIRIHEAGVTVHDPALKLGRMIEQQEDELLARYRRVSGTRSDVVQLEVRYVQPAAGREEQAVERIEGLDNVRERIAELSFFARSSVDAVQPGGPQSAASLEASRPLDLRAVRRQLRMRVIHEASVLNDELNRVYLRELVMLGVDARVADPPLGRMLILDQQIALVPLDPADSRRGALVVHNPGLVSGLADLFNRAWAAARELPWSREDGAGEGGPEITEVDLRVLSMLASGCTDETAAREIGVSVRHLRRRIARLMLVLGARSRFEAGVEAARRGLL
jgi:DNA-binding NarL/FixJ family response regulator